MGRLSACVVPFCRRDLSIHTCCILGAVSWEHSGKIVPGNESPRLDSGLYLTQDSLIETMSYTFSERSSSGLGGLVWE